MAYISIMTTTKTARLETLSQIAGAMISRGWYAADLLAEMSGILSNGRIRGAATWRGIVAAHTEMHERNVPADAPVEIHLAHRARYCQSRRLMV